MLQLENFSLGMALGHNFHLPGLGAFIMCRAGRRCEAVNAELRTVERSRESLLCRDIASKSFALHRLQLSWLYNELRSRSRAGFMVGTTLGALR
jgi:hypothetical protein